MDGFPWVGLPFGSSKDNYNDLIPCTGYPTPGVIHGATGKVIDEDAFGRVDDENYENWMKQS